MVPGLVGSGGSGAGAAAHERVRHVVEHSARVRRQHNNLEDKLLFGDVRYPPKCVGVRGGVLFLREMLLKMKVRYLTLGRKGETKGDMTKQQANMSNSVKISRQKRIAPRKTSCETFCALEFFDGTSRATTKSSNESPAKRGETGSGPKGDKLCSHVTLPSASGLTRSRPHGHTSMRIQLGSVT